MEYCSITPVISSKASGEKIRQMEKDAFTIETVIFTKETINTIWQRDRGTSFIVKLKFVIGVHIETTNLMA
jgi:hypothetical protein